jgi:hypothetical protein
LEFDRLALRFLNFDGMASERTSGAKALFPFVGLFGTASAVPFHKAFVLVVGWQSEWGAKLGVTADSPWGMTARKARARAKDYDSFFNSG